MRGGKFVTKEYLDIEGLREDHAVKGFTTSGRLREELEDMPILEGFLGPMFDGYAADGSCYFVRYESSEAYDVLST